jgi:branched-chain amino acid transport system permease protein
MTAAIIQQIVIGLSVAAMYLLVSLGLSLVFGMMNVLNFAHGVLYALGAYIGYVIATHVGSFWVALLVAPLLVALVGIGIEQITIQRLSNRPHLIQFLATYAVAMVIEEIIRIVMGNSAYSIRQPAIFAHSVSILGLEFPGYRLFLIGAAIVICSAVAVFLRWSRWGAVIRASSEDPEMAELLKVNTRFVSVAVFAGGSALAALAGVLAAPLYSIYPSMGEEVIAIAFLVVAVGGMGSLAGTAVSALIYGQLSTVGVLAVGNYADVVTLFAMGAVLLFRPTGLFATLKGR